MAARSLFQLVLLCAMGFVMEAKKASGDGLYQCLTFQGCTCGKSGQDQINKCFEILTPSSLAWFLGELGKCDNLNVTFGENESVQEWAPKMCAQDEDVKRKCFDEVNEKVRQELTLSGSEDFDEEVLYSNYKAYDCIGITINLCKEFPGECAF